jgi:hypothetical protein
MIPVRTSLRVSDSAFSAWSVMHRYHLRRVLGRALRLQSGGVREGSAIGQARGGFYRGMAAHGADLHRLLSWLRLSPGALACVLGEVSGQDSCALVSAGGGSAWACTIVCVLRSTPLQGYVGNTMRHECTSRH